MADNAFSAWNEHSESQWPGPVQAAKNLADNAEAFHVDVNNHIEGQWPAFFLDFNNE